MSQTYTAERTLGGQIAYDCTGKPLDKSLDVARLSPHGFDWGPEADPEAVLQLAIAILVDHRDWRKAVDHYRTLAAHIQDEYGDQNSWELESRTITQLLMDEDGGDRFEDRLPSPRDVDIETVDLEEMTLATESALCERYGISRYETDPQRRQTLRDVKEQGPEVLDDDDEGESSGSQPNADVNEFDTDADIDVDAENERTEDGENAGAATDTVGDGPANTEGGDRAAAPDDDTGEATPPASDQGELVASDGGETNAPADADPEDVLDGLPATPANLRESFPELDEPMADDLAELYDTVNEILNSTPEDLLEHDAVSTTVVTRLTRSIDWKTTTPIGMQALPGFEPPMAPSDDEPASGDEDDVDDDTSGEGTSADASVTTEETPSQAPTTQEADDDDEHSPSEGDTGRADEITAWVPNGDGYSVRGVNSARIYSERERPGNYSVYLESNSGTTYQVAQHLGGEESDRVMNRLSNAVAPVTIEYGGADLAAVLEDVEGASMPDAPVETAGDTGADGDSTETAENGASESTLIPQVVKDEFDIHGPPAHALAEAFDSQDALVEAVTDDVDLTDIGGVGETTVHALRDHLLEDDDADSASESESETEGGCELESPEAPGEEFEWVGSEKPLVGA